MYERNAFPPPKSGGGNTKKCGILMLFTSISNFAEKRISPAASVNDSNLHKCSRLLRKLNFDIYFLKERGYFSALFYNFVLKNAQSAFLQVFIPRDLW